LFTKNSIIGGGGRGGSLRINKKSILQAFEKKTFEVFISKQLHENSKKIKDRVK